MPRAKLEEQPASSPQLHFQPPPRRIFGTLVDTSQHHPSEPLRSVNASGGRQPRGTRVFEQRKPEKLQGAVSGTSPAGRRRKKLGGVTRKHSDQDLQNLDDWQDELDLDFYLDVEEMDSPSEGQAGCPTEGYLWNWMKSPSVLDADIVWPSLKELNLASRLALNPASSQALEPEGQFDSDAMDGPLLAELRSQGPGAVQAFRTALAEGTQSLNSVKLCFVGHARAGKTSTLLSLAGRPFDPNQPSTHGVETCTLAKELLSSGISRASSWIDDGQQPETSGAMHETSAWQVLEEQGSVAELLEATVAETVAATLRANWSESLQSADRGGQNIDPSSQPFNPSDELLPPAVKMPVDLIARAISNSSGRSVSSAAAPVIMQTWDFAGQELYYTMAHVFLTANGIYALVLDLAHWGKAMPSVELLDSLDFWLAALLVHAPKAQLIVVGTHADELIEETASAYKRLDEHLTSRLNAMPGLQARLHANEVEQLLFFPVDNRRSTPSARQSVDRLRAALNELAVKAADVRIPTRWAHFFKQLEDTKSGPCVSLEGCRELGSALCFRPGEVEACLLLFHRLGQLLYFEGSPAVVLDPQWLLDAMAQVAACPRVLQAQLQDSVALHDRGELSEQLLAVLWKAPRFKGQEKILKAFLEQFDLLVPGPTGKMPWLVPSLLPRRPHAGLHAAKAQTEEVTLLLNFHGMLARLLPTLLPRLLCQLRRRGLAPLRVFEVFQDSAVLSLGSPPLLLRLGLVPAERPEVLSVGVSCGAPGQILQASLLKALLAELRSAVTAWLPNICFSTCLPCPLCSSGWDQVAWTHGLRHFLDLDEVLRKELLYCSEARRLVEHLCLPRVVLEWRELEDAKFVREAKEQRQGHKHFLYASPLHSNTERLPQLDVAQELRHMRCPEMGRWFVKLATVDSLQCALLAQPPLAVLHITSHCVLRTNCAGRRMSELLLEDKCSSAHALGGQALADLGPWSNLGLLVVPSCGSLPIAEELVRHGLRCAICCTEEVLDSAVRLYCKTFYIALALGQTVAACHELAQASLRSSEDPVHRGQAGRFVLLGNTLADYCVVPSLEPDLQEEVRWPLLSRVEDYKCQVIETVRLATTFLSRRAVLLYGPEGYGKTALSTELCCHFSAPGRLFSAGAFFLKWPKDRLSSHSTDPQILQQALAQELVREISLRHRWSHSVDEPMKDLRVALQRLEAKGRWLIVVDDAFEDVSSSSAELQSVEEAALIKFLEGLLSDTVELRLLLTGRAASPRARWASLGSCKVVPVQPPLLSSEDGARLFASRCWRPLFAKDFVTEDSELSKLGAGPVMGVQLWDKLQTSPVLQAIGGVPGRIVGAAAEVDHQLSSLLEHPLLLKSGIVVQGF